VKSGAAGALEHGDQHGQWLRAAVARLAHDAKAPVLRQRATGPSVRNVRLPPRRSTSSLLTIPPRVGNGLIPYIANRCDTGGADGAPTAAPVGFKNARLARSQMMVPRGFFSRCAVSFAANRLTVPRHNGLKPRNAVELE
jgi:hypothetical protein